MKSEGEKIKVNINKDAKSYLDGAIEILKTTKWKTRQDLRSANLVFRLVQMAKVAIEKDAKK